jgi:hypothetical protein
MVRHPDAPGNRMSTPNSESEAFENSTAAREAVPIAVETRSEFRYRNRGGSAAKNGAVASRSRGAHPPRVHQHAPSRAELKKMRPQAGGCFDKSGARRTRRHPRAGALPGTMHEKRGIWNFDCSSRGHANRRRNSFRVPLQIQRVFLPSLTVRS